MMDELREVWPELRRKLLVPGMVFWALLLLLSAISVIGVAWPVGHWWVAEAACAAIMVTLVIVFSMEMQRHAPIVRLFSLLGFFWVAILFGMISLDYLTRPWN